MTLPHQDNELGFYGIKIVEDTSLNPNIVKMVSTIDEVVMNVRTGNEVIEGEIV